MDLKGKTALVTGGGVRLGRAFVLALAREGANVVIHFNRSDESVENTVQRAQAFGVKVFPIQANFEDFSAVENLFPSILQQHKAVDILVNNAGITRDGLMARMKESDWDAVLTTNLKGSFLCAKAAARFMMKKRWGRIINITSVIGFAGNAGQVNYASAKAGLVGLTKSMAREYSSRNITVNGVAPGYIVTDMTSSLSGDIQEQIKSEIPLGILGTPEDVAGAVAYLAGDDAGYVTGQVIHVNGGMYM